MPAKAYLVYMTFSTSEEAERIGSILVEERLAACVNILPGMKSVYLWEGAMEKAEEVVMIAKTNLERTQELMGRVASLHSYACPCMLAIPVEQGYEPFLVWIHNSVR
ncbi:MAG: divalent-cation tolerance protein CutA [Bacteroidota bacterium]|nr:divalent-cation tolerance protein CutA [Candidatus Kapabacteria bacterium]MDW8221274.1 divalent-cation tolerance protein CutA [Bacteroidota bacterium]